MLRAAPWPQALRRIFEIGSNKKDKLEAIPLAPDRNSQAQEFVIFCKHQLLVHHHF